MNQLELFLPCAAGVEDYLSQEVMRITGRSESDVIKQRGGVAARASWRDVMLLNLHSRLAQRVLVLLSYGAYRQEQDLYRMASEVSWEAWFTPKESIKVEVTAQHSPLTSLNFAALKIKDAVCDRFRIKANGVRPDVDTHWPKVRIYAHLTTDQLSLYIDTSGEPLFKRGWREDTGDAPLKETLAAAMIVATGWLDDPAKILPLYDPCCGSGTIAIEAAQMLCHLPAGGLRRFAFEHMLPFQKHVWQAIKEQAYAASALPTAAQHPRVFGSDVSHRMVDFAQRNAERAGVAALIEFRGGDALQRMPPSTEAGVLLLNPPYGERIDVGGVAGSARTGGGRSDLTDGRTSGTFVAREAPQAEQGTDFFEQLASHWKRHYPGWTAWMLTPDMKLPGKMRLKASRRVPLWNGPLECRLFRFDMVAGKLDARDAAGSP